MSAFKKLKKQDVFTVPYVAHKDWSFTFNSLPTSSDYIVIYEGEKPTGSFDINLNATTSLGEYETLVYTQINAMFYQQYSSSLNTSSLMLTLDNYISASDQRSPSYFIYNDNPGFVTNFPTGSDARIQVISISKNIFGERILPGSININANNVNVFEDDGRGNITRFGVPVGNIFYSQGLIVITDEHYQYWWYPLTISFKNERTIHEHYIVCTINESEFNLTYNPSLLTNSTSLSSSLQDFATGSDYRPYTTTVGLYNDNNDLLMVAKLAQPIQISSETDMTFLLKYDM